MGVDSLMYVKVRRKLTETELRRASWQLCAVFGADRFFVTRPGGNGVGDGGGGQHALERVDWDDDFRELNPEPGGTLVECHVATRYYGPGYERGDLSLLVGVAMFLEATWPGSEVWYGGDSGAGLKLFDHAARLALVQHAASERGADYRMHDPAGVPSQMCGFCRAPMTQGMWGGSYQGYFCLGCRLYRAVHQDGSVREAVGKYPDEKKVTMTTLSEFLLAVGLSTVREVDTIAGAWEALQRADSRPVKLLYRPSVWAPQDRLQEGRPRLTPSRLAWRLDIPADAVPAQFFAGGVEALPMETDVLASVLVDFFECGARVLEAAGRGAVLPLVDGQEASTRDR